MTGSNLVGWIAIQTAATMFAWSASAAQTSLPPTEAFARLPDLDFVTLSPDGAKLAWVRDVGGDPVIVIYDLAQRKPLKQIRPEQRFKVRDLVWSGSETVLFTLSVTWDHDPGYGRRRHEIFRVLATETKEGPARPLLMEDAARRHVTSARIVFEQADRSDIVTMSSWDFSEIHRTQELGSRLAGGRKDSGWVYSLFEVNTYSGKSRRLESGTPFTNRWIVDARGQPVARSDWNPEMKDYSVHARQGRGWKKIFGADSDRELELVGLSIDGKTVVAIGTGDDDYLKAWTLPLDGQPMQKLHEDAARDVEWGITDRFTGAVVGLQLGGLEPVVHWLDPHMRAIQQAVDKAFPHRQVSVFDRTHDYRRVLVRVEGPTTAPEYLLVDLSRGTADLIGAAYPQLIDVPLGARKPVSYRARDGLTIPAYVTLPSDRAPRNLPAVVLPHGGPEARDEPGFDWWSHFLASRGYAVLQPQFRGSTGYGATLQVAGLRQWGRAMQDDLADGVEHLVKEGVIDPARVCIVGASYGGYAALAGAAFDTDRYVCAASINGVADLPAMFGYLKNRYGDESETLLAWREMVGRPSDADLASISPARNVAGIRIPILLLHGSDDVVVPFTQSSDFARALKEQGKPHKLVELPGEDHWMSRSEFRLRAMSELEQFLDQHLQPGPPPTKGPANVGIASMGGGSGDDPDRSTEP